MEQSRPPNSGLSKFLTQPKVLILFTQPIFLIFPQKNQPPEAVWKNRPHQNLSHLNFRSNQNFLYFPEKKTEFLILSQKGQLPESVWKNRWLGPPNFLYFLWKTNLVHLDELVNLFDTELLDRYYITKGFKSVNIITLISRKRSHLLCLKLSKAY